MAIEYFDEAIRQKNDVLSMYNLASILLYDETVNKDDEKMFKFLSNSLKKGFSPSANLLCLALIKKYGFDINEIRKNLMIFQRNQ